MGKGIHRLVSSALERGRSYRDRGSQHCLGQADCSFHLAYFGYLRYVDFGHFELLGPKTVSALECSLWRTWEVQILFHRC